MQSYMSERDGKDKKRITQRNPSRAGWLAIVDYPQAAPTCIFVNTCLVLFRFRLFYFR